uniref:Cytochrome c oxidase subunit 2 n=1 Tax=Ardeacarus ardeae TaxID=1932962 RepID=A0A343BSH6_9ACAR|nr:cytochrome oxidase subunit 2 [Ardeacarus ardeae]
MPSWMNLGFQDSCSPFMVELVSFYDYVMVLMTGIIFLILYIMTYMMTSKFYYKSLSEGTFIEVVWSVVPVFLLVVLVLPSIKILYLMEDIKSPSMTFKVMGHQWYWSYAVPLFKNFFFKLNNEIFDFYEFDSMLEEDSFPRLLECNDELVIPINSTSRFLISSGDVIHSFTIPSLGVKVDAFPGRINQLFLNPMRLGIFYGQCSEICGSNHSFMPIMLKVVDLKEYDSISGWYLVDLLEEEFSKSFLGF